MFEPVTNVNTKTIRYTRIISLSGYFRGRIINLWTFCASFTQRVVTESRRPLKIVLKLTERNPFPLLLLLVRPRTKYESLEAWETSDFALCKLSECHMLQCSKSLELSPMRMIYCHPGDRKTETANKIAPLRLTLALPSSPFKPLARAFSLFIGFLSFVLSYKQWLKETDYAIGRDFGSTWQSQKCRRKWKLASRHRQSWGNCMQMGGLFNLESTPDLKTPISLQILDIPQIDFPMCVLLRRDIPTPDCVQTNCSK